MDAKDRIIEQRIEKRRHDRQVLKTVIALLLLFVLLAIGILVYAGMKNGAIESAALQITSMLTGQNMPENNGGQVVTAETKQEEETNSGNGGTATVETTAETDTEAETPSAVSAQTQEILSQAALLAAQYDYDGAIELLKSQSNYNTATDYQNAVANYQSQKDGCISYPLSQITHVFFHTLIKDDAKAFDGDQDEAGYNQVMTTISEFNSIIQQMYDRGYVMVSLHDMCKVNADGTVSEGEILLPADKKPFVLSQDDVSYYHYMKGDGFADKLIVDENGDIRNTYIEDDGSTSIGDYDMVPLIDRFVEEHPDFSYHGHKGILALTGYEGVLGYRTDEVYKTRDENRLTAYQKQFLEETPDFDYDQEVADATAVADAMKAEGWEFASHTWGHINPVAYGYDKTVTDTERWLSNVAPVVGDTDVLIFAFGADINDWTPYTHDNEFFDYLKKQGFSIYCNVDGSQTSWVQFGDDYMRQGRRNLDGYRMYYNPELLSDLFDVDEAWDDNRPTPVPEMGG